MAGYELIALVLAAMAISFAFGFYDCNRSTESKVRNLSSVRIVVHSMQKLNLVLFGKIYPYVTRLAFTISLPA